LLSAGYSLEVLGDMPMDEDCLFLNVWTPDTKPKSKLPVMVWILPGGFQVGDGSMPRYDGTNLAKHGVVAVT
ncbi:MAG: carboxylesterase family protein, partial [Rhodospirillaceae bacterium]